MSSELLSVVGATLLISSGSLIGVLTLAMNQKFLNKILLSLVSLSAGTMIAASFLHLLPESIEALGEQLPLQLALASFIGFFLLERLLHWRHCHDEEHIMKHTVGTLNLLGDALHNFIDGLLIAASFAGGVELGIITALAIALHEIPQEIGDFAVLLHSGFSRRRALFYNILVSMTCVAGGVLGYLASHSVEAFANYLIPVAAGAFIYISAADLIPDLKHTKSPRKIASIVVTFLLGVTIMMMVRD